ncbi:L,D-transpeptidase family protein [Candidatus Deferrimicrobium sp.]|uniref:L,D-transpeptidase family protein n=1 Tax=Candidatus Deferrimicrobium sp. TaxID=3060586 RepID=UPI003C3DB138
MRKPRIFPFGSFKFCICLLMASMLLSGCSHFNDGRQLKTTFAEANELFHQGSYAASLDKYSEITEKYPAKADRALFEMGFIHAHPKNPQKDYQKALECFQKLIKDYPGSEYRQNSEMMIFNIRNVALKDMTIAAQQVQIETLQHKVQGKENEIVTLQKTIEAFEKTIEAFEKKIEALEKKFFDYAIRKGSVDRILIEKSTRRLMLISQGEVLKSYKIALGGNPIGPKERQGDNKTPEGTYVIDARNRDSRFHLSLRISYPNERDKKRARELGVSPGGDIMIHGIKNGFSWVGDAHTGVDWTKGCMAVTDQEIEEIDKLAPNGTIVEIRP